MDNSESGDDLGNSFLSVESQGYMVQGEELDGKVMFNTELMVVLLIVCSF
jgi:hypothetical protein